MAGDLPTAIAEYEAALKANPADEEATLGLARAKLMQRTAVGRSGDCAGRRQQTIPTTSKRRPWWLIWT